MIANGFIHMLHVELEISKYIKNYTNDTTSAINSVMDNNCSDEKRIQLNNSHHHEKNKLINSFICDASKGCDNSYRSSTTIVDRIIADFAENETESCNLEKSVLLSKIDKSILGNSKNFDELIITCGSQPSVNLNQASSSSSVRLLSHQNHRIINKNLMRTSGNCITTIDLNSTSSLPITETTTVPNKKLDIAAKAYEFSEDNEKCEKISIFRKRRLADKKYEFSEDNSENIIPFNRIRTFPLLTKFHKTSTTSSTNLFSTAVPNYEVTSHLHRASPNHGFRSPCGSPVGNRCMKSPPGSARSYFYHPRSPTYAMRSPNTLSPRQLKRTTNLEYETGLSSPRNDDLNFLHSPQMTTGSKNDKPICSKKFIRRFVEEDDATSVITSEEDDCISPGYHTSLPMEVHGSCYSDMQMISLSSYTKLKCPAVVITQHSFDLETFTFHVANHLCLMNNKKYGIFYDWACELVHVCPLSFILTFILMVHFTAIDTLPTGTKECLNCVNNLDCVFHRKQYQCRTLFTWNLESGDWTVLDYGDLLEVAQKSNVKNSGELNQVLQKIAADLFNNLNDLESFNNLRVLDCCNDKSKEFLRDYQNSIEFYRSVGKTSDSEFSDDSN